MYSPENLAPRAPCEPGGKWAPRFLGPKPQSWGWGVSGLPSPQAALSHNNSHRWPSTSCVPCPVCGWGRYSCTHSLCITPWKLCFAHFADEDLEVETLASQLVIPRTSLQTQSCLPADTGPLLIQLQCLKAKEDTGLLRRPLEESYLGDSPIVRTLSSCYKENMLLDSREPWERTVACQVMVGRVPILPHKPTVDACLCSGEQGISRLSWMTPWALRRGDLPKDIQMLRGGIRAGIGLLTQCPSPPPHLSMDLGLPQSHR